MTDEKRVTGVEAREAHARAALLALHLRCGDSPAVDSLHLYIDQTEALVSRLERERDEAREALSKYEAPIQTMGSGPVSPMAVMLDHTRTMLAENQALRAELVRLRSKR